MKLALHTSLILGLSAAFLHAQAVPGLISYQGRIVDGTGTGLGTGTPVNRKILFRLFDAGTAGTRLWSEEQTVTISNGDFSVILGQGVGASYNGSPENPKPSLLTVFGGTDRYLEMIVDNGDGTLGPADSPITPRQRLISTAFAIRAATADSVASGSDLSLGTNNGLGFYDTARNFGGVNVNGPVLYGAGGGVLGTSNGAAKNIALQWNSTGNVGIGGSAPSSTHKLDVSGSIHGSSDLTIDGKIGVATDSPMAKVGIRSNNSLPAMAFEFTSGGYRHFLQTRHHNTPGLGNAFDFYLNNSNTDGGSTAPGTGNIHGMTIDATGVGIGVTAPTAKLDVAGNIKSSGDILLDGNKNISLYDANHGLGYYGSASTAKPTFENANVNGPVLFGWAGGALGSTSGENKIALSWDSSKNVTVGGNLTVAGKISGGIRMPNSFAIDDVNFGGGSSQNYISFGHPFSGEDYIGYRNATFHFKDSPGGGESNPPNIIVDGSGAFGGNLTAGGSGAFGGNLTAANKSVAVGDETLRIVRGNVASDGSKERGAGFTSTRIGVGHYRITFSTAFPDVPSVTATPWSDGTTYDYIRVANLQNGQIDVAIHASGGGVADRNFSFIVVGPR